MARVETDTIALDGQTLSLGDVEKVARAGGRAMVASEARPAVEASRQTVSDIAATGTPTYGVNTGLGALSSQAIAPSDLRALQHNLLRSHASGSGPLLPNDIVRATMVIRANSLAKGYSGVRVEVIEQILSLLNAGITPAIPAQGSLGASGDLAPLAHLGLALTGEGQVVDAARVEMPAGEALAAVGIQPLTLEPKEALALINGTAVIAGVATLAARDSQRLVSTAIVVAGLSAFALGALPDPFDARLHLVRAHPGQRRVAGAMRNLLCEQSLDHRASRRVQDPYSVRCIPPVIGAVLDSLGPLTEALSIEINSATDNPLIFPDTDDALSGGNFHGHPLALPIEYEKTAVASLGTFSERRVALLMDGGEYGLPAFLAFQPGLNSGYMIAHYLAASLTAENKVLAHPSAVDSIPTSANIEDFNSMGATASRHFADIVANVETVVAVEALCAAQACDLRSLTPSGTLGESYRLVRSKVGTLERDDRIIADDVAAMTTLIRGGDLAALIDVEDEAS